MKKQDRVWALLAGGGTLGHVAPGLAIAEEISMRANKREVVHFVGSRRGIETTLVPEAGFTLTAITGRGIVRKLTWRNLSSIIGIAFATIQTIANLARWRPAVVLGLGGFASVPAVVAAKVWRIPLIIAEQNAVASAANRLGAKFAKAAAVPFDGVNLPRAVLTGNPVRASIVNINRDQDQQRAREQLGIDPQRKLLSVFGGSLGAGTINDALFAALDHWQDRQDLAIRHITGKRDHAELIAKAAAYTNSDLALQIIEFETDMATVYAASDLILCRAGATSIAEISATGVPAILVPLPETPGDHQNANAKVLTKTQAAVVIADHELNEKCLRREVDNLINDKARLAAMSAAAQKHSRPRAAAAVVDLLERYAKRPLPIDQTHTSCP